jgi:rod shape-determining protein MreC
MAAKKKNLFFKAVLVTSLASPFVFFSTSLKPWSLASHLGLVCQEFFIYPAEYLWSEGLHVVRDAVRHYVTLHHAAQENSQLHSEINQMRARILDYEEQVQEASRLRQLLGFVDHYQSREIMAEVIGFPTEDPFQTLRIGKGEWDELKIGMPVVTAGGIVGRIIRTGLKFSDIQLLTDSNFNLDVLLQRTRDRGVLKGMSGRYCLLKLNRRSEIRIGDTVITSGIVGGFKKGLPVGRVVRISYESDNISQMITVEPWVDYYRLEEVIVLESADRELQKIVDSAGKSWLKKSVDTAAGG